jgi:hypothetical protein
MPGACNDYGVEKSTEPHPPSRDLIKYVNIYENWQTLILNALS